MKIFITGDKGVGKSHLIKTLVKEFHLSICGFQTLPIYKDEKRVGFYFHSLVETYKNDQMFAISQAKDCLVIKNVFDTLGVECLNKSKLEKHKVLILDEIGRLEANELAFIKALQDCIEEHPFIIGVLKKCDRNYIQEIKNRKDVTLYHLNKENYDKIYMQIKEILKEKLYEKNI